MRKAISMKGIDATMFWTVRLKKRFFLGMLGALCIGAFVLRVALPVNTACSEEDSLVCALNAAQGALPANAGGEKVVYLTFDDGPSQVTEGLLDVLKEYNVKATFFVMADENNQKYLPILQRTKSDGHLIALHTATHQYSKIYRTAEAYWQDLDQLRGAVEPFTGELPNILRFPGGSTNTVAKKGVMKQLKAEAEAKGYRYFDWNVCANDSVGGKRSVEYITDTVIKGADNISKAVVLFHDGPKNDTSVKALPTIIKWFQDNGYRFDTIDNYPAPPPKAQ